jgi:hypothetical protein
MWHISSRSRDRGLVRPSTGEFEMSAAKGVDACNPVFPVTVVVWGGTFVVLWLSDRRHWSTCLERLTCVFASQRLVCGASLRFV